MTVTRDLADYLTGIQQYLNLVSFLNIRLFVVYSAAFYCDLIPIYISGIIFG